MRWLEHIRDTGELWRSTHPGPTLVVTLLSAGLGVSVGLSIARLLLLTIAVFFGQVSIGLSNDVLDAHRDRAVGRTDKPLALPDAPLRTAWAIAIASASLALLLSGILGWGLTLAHLVFIAAGWVYNSIAKSTVWSVLCFIIGFGMVPSLPTLSLPVPQVAPVWATVAGATLGVAIHFSNVLPDLADDKLTGVRGLPHRLGRQWSALVAAVTLIAGSFCVSSASDVTAIPWIGFAFVTGIAVCGYAASVFTPATRTAFRLVMLAALLLVAQIMLTGGLAT